MYRGVTVPVFFHWEMYVDVLQVICVGQIICAVVAETLTQAKRGAKKVKIVYEDLQPVLTIKVAMHLLLLLV